MPGPFVMADLIGHLSPSCQALFVMADLIGHLFPSSPT